MNWKVPFFDLQLGIEEKNAVLSVLDSNWLTAGPRISEFEDKFSNAIGEGTYSVAVSSATAALHLSLIALNIGPGDEVIVPSLTFVACANVIKYVGAIPVFADISSSSDWNISLADVKNKITSNTKAIMAVHFAGYPCDLDGLQKLACSQNIHLIEDCSHAPFAKYQNKPVGTFGAIGCFSFFSNKNMTTGEGGMVLTKSKEIWDRIRVLRSHGISSSTYQRFKGHSYDYDVSAIGYNYRLDEIRAAIGIEQLKKVHCYQEIRRHLTFTYKELIKHLLPSVIVPFANHSGDSAFHIFPILLPLNLSKRDHVIKLMAEAGIQCSMHYRPIHTFTAYKGVKAFVPVTDSISDSILTLPLFPGLKEGQIGTVVSALSDCIEKTLEVEKKY